MKIYTKVVIDMETGKVLHEESYEYDGEIARCGSSSTQAQTPPAPVKSAEQQELEQLQLTRIRRQERREKELDPFILENMGFRRNADDELERIPENERVFTPEQALSREIFKLQQNRQIAALKGKLPVDPALEDEIRRNRKKTELGLRATKGSRYAETTAGITKLAELERTEGLVRAGVRRGELTSGEAALITRMGLMSRQQTQTQTNLTNLQLPGLRQSQAIRMALSPYQQFRSQRFNNELQARLATAANYTSLFRGGQQLAGTSQMAASGAIRNY